VIYPDANPNVIVNLGPLGLEYILLVGDVGYFRKRVVEPYAAAGRLKIVAEVPKFCYPVYVTHPADTDNSILKRALTGLRQIHVDRPAIVSGSSALPGRRAVGVSAIKMRTKDN